MFTIIGLMLTGMLLGFLLRKQKLSGIHKVITVLIWLLLFLLGIDVGGNQKIINGLHTIGLEAIVITLAAVLGSVTAAWALWYVLTKEIRRDKYERKFDYRRILCTRSSLWGISPYSIRLYTK